MELRVHLLQVACLLVIVELFFGTYHFLSIGCGVMVAALIMHFTMVSEMAAIVFGVGIGIMLFVLVLRFWGSNDI